MAKTPKVKKRTTSIRSRAARRAGSPTIDVGVVPAAPSQPTYTPHNPSPGGIRKKKTSLSRNQKIRRLKGAERADAVAARTEIKKAKSLGKAKVVKECAKDWEDVNTKGKKKTKPIEGFSVLTEMDVDDQQDGMVKALPIRGNDASAPEPDSDSALQQPRISTVRFANQGSAADDI